MQPKKVMVLGMKLGRISDIDNPVIWFTFKVFSFNSPIHSFGFKMKLKYTSIEQSKVCLTLCWIDFCSPGLDA